MTLTRPENIKAQVPASESVSCCLCAMPICAWCQAFVEGLDGAGRHGKIWVLVDGFYDVWIMTLAVWHHRCFASQCGCVQSSTHLIEKNIVCFERE